MTLSLPFRPFAMRRRPDASGIDASGNAGHNLPYGTLAVLPVRVAVVPVGGPRTLPRPDYPSHLARLYLLTTGDANPILDGIYGIRWEPLPSLAMDLVALPLARILALTDAGR